jgi:hypothetical protein
MTLPDAATLAEELQERHANGAGPDPLPGAFVNDEGQAVEDTLDWASKRIGVEVEKVEKIVGEGREPKWHLTVKHRRGNTVEMAPITGARIIDAHYMRQQFFAGAGKAIERLKDKEWGRIAEALDHAAVERDTGDSQKRAWTERLASFARESLGGGGLDIDAATKAEIIDSHQPHFIDTAGRLWVHKESFENHLRNIERIYTKGGEVGEALTLLGFEHKQLTAKSRRSGKNVSRNYYYSPTAFEAEA